MLLFLLIGKVKTTSSVALASINEANLLALPPSASLALESAWSEDVVALLFSAQWCFDLSVAAKVISTTQCFSSNITARDFVSTLGAETA